MSPVSTCAPIESHVLPPLQVGIYEDGQLVLTVDIPDPRANFCRFWEELHANHDNSIAKPIGANPLPAGEGR